MADEVQVVRTWSHVQRMLKLRQSVEWLGKSGTSPSDAKVQVVLDIVVAILLETFREALPSERPSEVFLVLLDTRRGEAWGMVGMRFLDSLKLIERFTACGKEEKQRLRSKMSARGLL